MQNCEINREGSEIGFAINVTIRKKIVDNILDFCYPIGVCSAA